MTMTPVAPHATNDTPVLRTLGEERVPRPGVVERLTQILDVFTHDEQRLLLDDVTAATGLPRSTAFRLLSQMVDLDWLEHGAAGYQLGARALRMGKSESDHTTLRGAAADLLNALHLRTGGVAHLAVLDGKHAHYLDKVGGAALRTIPSNVGARLRADTTACGQVLLAALSPEKVDQLFARDDETRLRSRLHRLLGHVRNQRGIVVQPADICRMGIGTVAAPILGPRGPVGAISVAVRNGPGIERVAPLVANAARRTSTAMFPTLNR